MGLYIVKNDHLLTIVASFATFMNIFGRVISGYLWNKINVK